MRYAMSIKKGERNYSAHLPDLPGRVAAGKTLEELKRRTGEVVELHMRGTRGDGPPAPEPTGLVEYVEAAWRPPRARRLTEPNGPSRAAESARCADFGRVRSGASGGRRGV